jgi:predicted MFS family arabinose efflux permease
MLGRPTIVAALGTTQTLAWASSYYLVAILADPIAEELDLTRAAVFGIFSASLLLAAVLGPAVGRAIDRGGGRRVLVLSNIVMAAGLTMLAAAQGWVTLAVAWALLGAGMALGLYDSAFAVLAGLYGRDARGAITGITLIAGFASTVGWPTTALLNDLIDWRGACLFWAGLHLVLGLPLNRFVVPAASPPHSSNITERLADPASGSPAQPGAMALLAFIFAATWFVTGAIAAHLPRLLEAAGATPARAIAAAALVGPAQVAARLIEFGLLKHLHPVIAARIAATLHPAGAAFLALFGAPGAMFFALLHGAGNGMLTIAKGTLPLTIFGPEGYGHRSGLLSAPSRTAQAAAPLLFGVLLDNGGVSVALACSAGLSLAAMVALLRLRSR